LDFGSKKRENNGIANVPGSDETTWIDPMPIWLAIRVLAKQACTLIST
jgi:hypothetical protein